MDSSSPVRTVRFPYIDALRGVAVLMVLLCHSANAVGGSAHAWWGSMGFQLYTGVAVFFAISAFLLYRPYLIARRDERRPISALQFLRRRALRILPAYWIALTLLSVWPGLEGTFTGRWWIYYGLGQIYSEPTHAQGLTVAWTLSIEVSFYLLLPVYAILLGRLTAGRSRRGWMTIELAAAAAVGLPALAVQSLGKANAIPFETTRTLLGTSDWLAVGLALAVFSVAFEGQPHALSRVRRLADRPTLCLTLAAAALVVGAVAFDVREVVEPGWVAYVSNHVVSGVVTLLVMIPAVFAVYPRGLGARVLGSNPLRLIGLVSFGMFLWHYPLLNKLAEPVNRLHLPLWIGTLLLFAASLVVTLVPATLSYRLIELRGMRRARASRAPTPAAAAATRAEPVGVS